MIRLHMLAIILASIGVALSTYAMVQILNGCTC